MLASGVEPPLLLTATTVITTAAAAAAPTALITSGRRHSGMPAAALSRSFVVLAPLTVSSRVHDRPPEDRCIWPVGRVEQLRPVPTGSARRSLASSSSLTSIPPRSWSHRSPMARRARQTACRPGCVRPRGILSELRGELRLRAVQPDRDRVGRQARSRSRSLAAPAPPRPRGGCTSWSSAGSAASARPSARSAANAGPSDGRSRGEPVHEAQRAVSATGCGWPGIACHAVAPRQRDVRGDLVEPSPHDEQHVGDEVVYVLGPSARRACSAAAARTPRRRRRRTGRRARSRARRLTATSCPPLARSFLGARVSFAGSKRRVCGPLRTIGSWA